MDAKTPKCPNCKDGGSVKLVPPGKDIGMEYQNAMEVFQCTCGWTLARTALKTRPNQPGQPI
jgi:hypothetical protein